MHQRMPRILTTALVLLSFLPAAAGAEEPPPTWSRPLLSVPTLTPQTDAFHAQRSRRRGGQSQSFTTRRSWGRTFTGAIVLIGGAVAARAGHTRLGEINDRNTVRDEWNALLTGSLVT